MLVRYYGTVTVGEETKQLQRPSPNLESFFLKGLKTLVFEICEYLSWEVSDTRICPVGYGTTYLGLYQGFNELLEQGVIKRFPGLIGIQAEAIAPVYKTFSRKIGQIDRLERKKLLEKGENIVLILTGSGLKATEKLGVYVNA